jgi:hypothetical protein
VIDHDEILDRLDDWADDALEPEARLHVDAHLRSCDGCRMEAESLRRLREQAAALPREIQPARDLWAGIEARIEARRVIAFPAPVVAAPAAPAARPWWSRGAVLAAAAVVLMLASSAVTTLMLRDNGPAATASGGPIETPAAAPYSALVAFEPAEAEYVSAIDDLSLALAAGREVLDPATVAVIETNLGIIDAAIAEARAALEADPNNRELAHLLSGIYRRKVDLLKNAVLLQSQT